MPYIITQVFAFLVVHEWDMSGSRVSNCFHFMYHLWVIRNSFIEGCVVVVQQERLLLLIRSVSMGMRRKSSGMDAMCSIFYRKGGARCVIIREPCMIRCRLCIMIWKADMLAGGPRVFL